MRNVVVVVLLCAAACAQTAAVQPSPAQGPLKASCEQASLALDPKAVVATLDGQAVTAADLGPELIAAEQKALREYCSGVAQSRQMALDNYVTEKLVKKEADKAGKSQEDWIREQMMARAKEPTDAEIQAFYDERKSPETPPLELVKPQVAQAIQRERAETTIREIIDGLKKGAQVTESLPDVRPPAVDLAPPAYTAVAGKKGGKVQIVEFADFQCPYCSKAAETMSKLKSAYGDRVEFTFRHFPLSFHENARKAAEYAQCAGRQGKFWQLHDAIFQKQSELAEEDLQKRASEVGVDVAALASCIQSGDGAKEVEQDYQKGLSVGIEGTPSFFLNGRIFTGNPTFEGLKEAIDAELSKS